MEEKVYFRNIDFFKFIFALIIVVLHVCFWFWPYSDTLCELYKHHANMNYCVELFFIISGFFFVLTYRKETSILMYLYKKIIRLLPVLLFCVVTCFILSLFGILHFSFMDNVFALTFLNGLQIENTHTQINGWGCVFTSWYVSVLLWISLFFYFIVSNFGFKLLLLLLWIFIISGLYCSHYGLQTIVHHDVLRGLYSMSIGCVLGQIFFLYKEKALNAIIKVKTRIINTFFELGLLGYLLYAIITTKSHLAKIDIIFLFVLLMIFFIFKLGFLSKILDNNFSKLLGQYSYSIFLSHSVLMHVYKKFWYIEMNMQTFWTSIHGVVLSIIICVMFGVFVYYLVEKPSYSYLKRKYNL